MITKTLLPAAALAALLTTGPADAGISAHFGGLRLIAGHESAAVCPMPSAEAIDLDEVFERLEPIEL